MSCKGCPLCPAARYSVAQCVRAGWVYLSCWILYIIVSLAVSLRCSKDCHFNFFIISVGLLWCRQSLDLYVSGCSPLHHFEFVYILFGGWTVLPSPRFSSGNGLVLDLSRCCRLRFFWILFMLMPLFLG